MKEREEVVVKKRFTSTLLRQERLISLKDPIVNNPILGTIPAWTDCVRYMGEERDKYVKVEDPKNTELVGWALKELFEETITPEDYCGNPTNTD